LDQAAFARLRGELGVVFPFWASAGKVDVHMHVAFSFMYYIMVASLYQTAFVTYAIEMCFSHMLFSP
jgi:hypothetical protein